MARGHWYRPIIDAKGNLIPNIYCRVRRETGGLPLAQMQDRAGNPLGNPAFFPTGIVNLYAPEGEGGYFRIEVYSTSGHAETFYDEAIGSAAGADAPFAFVEYDAAVDTEAGLTTYDAEPEGFSVLVKNVGGSGRAALYTRMGVSGWIGPAWITPEGSDRFDVSMFIGRRPSPGELVARHVVSDIGVTFPAGLTGSEASAEAASTGTAVFSLQKNGVEFGTVTFTASDQGVLASASPAQFVAGDVLSVVAPSPRDLTLSDISITLAGHRT